MGIQSSQKRGERLLIEPQIRIFVLPENAGTCFNSTSPIEVGFFKKLRLEGRRQARIARDVASAEDQGGLISESSDIPGHMLL